MENSRVVEVMVAEVPVEEKSEKPVITVQPVSGFQWPSFHELWAFRELFYFFAWRDIKVRYKHTSIGIGWAFFQPLALMVVFTLFLGRMVHLPSDGLPYAPFALTGLIPWFFFANGVTLASTSLVLNDQLIKKVYFPRMILPCASIFSLSVDFLCAFSFLLLVLPIFDMLPSVRLLAVPGLMVLLLVATWAVGLWLSALNLLFRDVRHVIPLLMQLWLFMTPIAYSSTSLSYPWKLVYALNPMVGIIEAFHWVIFVSIPFSGWLVTSLLVSCLVSVGLLMLAIGYFQTVQQEFADRV